MSFRGVVLCDAVFFVDQGFLWEVPPEAASGAHTGLPLLSVAEETARDVTP